MSKDELIAKQQLEIEEYKMLAEQNKKLVSEISGSFTAIGRPLNDNVLQFNSRQLKWCFDVHELIQQLEF